MANLPLEVARGNLGVTRIPHVSQERRVGLGEFPVGLVRQRVHALLVQVLDEVLSELWDVREALDRAVHEACVPKVLQAHGTPLERRARDGDVVAVGRGGPERLRLRRPRAVGEPHLQQDVVVLLDLALVQGLLEFRLEVRVLPLVEVVPDVDVLDREAELLAGALLECQDGDRFRLRHGRRPRRQVRGRVHLEREPVQLDRHAAAGLADGPALDGRPAQVPAVQEAPGALREDLVVPVLADVPLQLPGLVGVQEPGVVDGPRPLLVQGLPPARRLRGAADVRVRQRSLLRALLRAQDARDADPLQPFVVPPPVDEEVVPAGLQAVGSLLLLLDLAALLHRRQALGRGHRRRRLSLLLFLLQRRHRTRRHRSPRSRPPPS
mmetsp:Transcript_100245/g.283889  ORF Transcript_100245/g.283889 Transcript_100245/m.283889 type:complete len:380 (-) Transcript_100245:23-1162(-)